MINLHDQMNMLMKKRTIFHSEADFQFALAWEIQKAYPDANVRLEYCPAKYPNMHLDMLVKIGEMGFPIELKYKTLITQMEVDGEYYNLKNHGAQDLGRYDYLIDVERIELLKNTISTFEKGYAIMLSNDPSYWVVPRSSKETVCDSYRIHEGCKKSGTLSWIGNPGAGTIKNRERSINLAGDYMLQWKEYSKLSSARNGTFRYLLLEVGK